MNATACRRTENDYQLTVDDAPTLDQLPVGAEGTVLAVRCERAIARRLMEMGVLPGTRITVLRIAPLGDPILLRLRSYSLSIRRREAAGIVLSDVREPVGAQALAEQAPS